MDTHSVTQAMINSALIVAFGAVLSFIAAWFWFARNAAVRKAEAIAIAHDALVARVAEQETRLRLSEQATQAAAPIVTAFQALMIQKLTHADKPEMDKLMVRVGPPDTLTDDERARLLVMLHERSQDMAPAITDGERDAARILPIVMRMAAEEQAGFATAAGSQDLKLVTIVSAVSADEGKKVADVAKSE